MSPPPYQPVGPPGEPPSGAPQGVASSPATVNATGKVVVPLWAAVLLGVGCGISILLAVIYAVVLTMTTDPNVVGGAWYLLSVGSLSFLISLVALVGVIRKSAWARVVTIVAGAGICFTCIGAVLGIPVIIGAAIARREA